jgi:hypothetical protein
MKSSGPQKTAATVHFSSQSAAQRSRRGDPLVADSAGRFDGHNFALKRGHEDRPSTFRCWPHVDDNGCNWPLLKHHAELCRTTPGLYAINLGDSSHNWTDRLIKLYAQQDWSVKTAPDDG